MKKNYLSLRGGKTLHLEYDNGRDDNNSSAFTLLYSMYNLFFKSLSFLIVNAQTYILPKQEKSAWKYEGDTWIWKFTIPKGVTATVTLPGEIKSKNYGSGTYKVTK